MSLGRYTDETSKLLRLGNSRRGAFPYGPAATQRLFLALVPRAEVTKSELRLYVRCYQLTRFLAWNGSGLFNKEAVQPAVGGDRVHVVSAAAHALCGKKTCAIPINPRSRGSSEPKP